MHRSILFILCIALAVSAKNFHKPTIRFGNPPSLRSGRVYTPETDSEYTYIL